MGKDGMRRQVRWRVAVAVSAWMVAACGGGGGGDNDSQLTPQAGTVTVTGVVAKGLVRGAVVTAYQPDDKGQPGARLAQGTSDINGRYSLPGIPQNTVVLLTVKPASAPAEPTTMVDEVSDDIVPVASDFEMQAVVLADAPAGGTQPVQITPYSTMAVAKARQLAAAQGRFDAQLVGDVNADVRRYVGYDVIAAAPEFDATGRTPRNAPALLLAAVADLAARQDASHCPALVGLSDAAALAAARVSCTLDAMADAGTSSEALAADLSAAIERSRTREAYTGEQPAAPAPQPATPTNVPVADIAAAKSLIAYLRSDVPFLTGDTGDTLRTRLQAVEQDLRAANPLDAGHVQLLQAMVHAAELLARREDGVPVTSWQQDGAGRQLLCTYYTDARFEVEAVRPEDRQTVACRLTYDMVVAGDSPSGTVMRALQHAIFLTPASSSDGPTGGQAEFVFRTALLLQDGQRNAEGVFVPDLDKGQHTILAAGGATEAWTSNLIARVRGVWNGNDDFTSLSIIGDLAPSPVLRDGQFAARGPKAMADLVLTPTTVRGGVSQLQLQGGFSAVDAAGGVSSVKLLAGSALQGRVDPAAPDDTHALISTEALALKLVLQAAMPSGNAITGTLEVSGFTDIAGAAASGLTASQRVGEMLSLPSRVSFVGTIDRQGQTLLRGSLTLTAEGLAQYDSRLPLADNPAVSLQLLLDASMQVPGRPDLVFKSTRLTQKQGGITLDGALQQGSVWVSAKGSVSRDEVVQLQLLSDSAVSLSIDSSQSSQRFPLRRNGRDIGIVDLDSGRITYADGSFEQ